MRCLPVLTRNALALALCLAPLYAQGVIHVDADATGAGTGTSWVDAFPELQSALDDWSPGDQIWVAEGSYFPSLALVRGDPRSVTFQLADGMALHGGFAGTETSLAQANPQAHPTILDGNVGLPGNPNDNSWHVLVADSTGPGTLVDGFTIARGRANGHEPGSTVFSNMTGGALSNEGGTLELRRCRFVDNQAFSSGGAIRSDVGALTIVDCEFIASVADNGGQSTPFGGALYLSGGVHRVERSRFEGSRAASAAAIYVGVNVGTAIIDCEFVDSLASSTSGNAGSGATVYLSSCTNTEITGSRFEGCIAPDGVGGISVLSGSGNLIDGCSFVGNQAELGAGIGMHQADATVRRSTFVANVADQRGGAISMSFSDAEITNCRFLGNQADLGGALSATGGQAGFQVFGSHPSLYNCEFGGNSARLGGALFANANSEIRLLFCTVADNGASESGGGLYLVEEGFIPEPGRPTVDTDNSILWGNADLGGSDETAQIHIEQGAVPIDHSIVQGWTGALGGTGNLGLDPQFRDADGLDGLAGTEDDDRRLGPASPAIDSGDNGQTVADAADLDCDGDVAEDLALDLGLVRRRADDPNIADTGLGLAPLVDRGAHERGAWEYLGSALAGTRGEPCLVGEGTLVAGELANHQLSNALENVPATLYIGISLLAAPFKGGTFVPSPDFAFFGLDTGPQGLIELPAIFPPGAPSGFQFWMQYWLADPAGPKGFAASNAVVATTP